MFLINLEIFVDGFVSVGLLRSKKLQLNIHFSNFLNLPLPTYSQNLEISLRFLEDPESLLIASAIKCTQE